MAKDSLVFESTMVSTLPPKPRIGPNGMGTGSTDDGFRGDGPRGSGGPRRPSYNTYRLGMCFALAAILMLFIALTSAYIVREGLSDDWRPIQMPPLLWFTTVVLLGSSFTLELARRSLKRGWVPAFNRWLSMSTVLGLAFLIGQIGAWRQLAEAGIYMSTNPHSSFFYTLTGTHGVHLLGGLVALFYLTVRAWRASRATAADIELVPAGGSSGLSRQGLAVDLTALYWHFMDILWIYLFILLFVWR